MEMSVKCFCIMSLLLAIYGLGSFNSAYAADSSCSPSTPDKEALKLAPCLDAATNKNAKVSARCCTAVTQQLQHPDCLCAIMLSNSFKYSGVKPEIALSIPQRCNIADRPVGYQCGAYKLP